MHPHVGDLRVLTRFVGPTSVPAMKSLGLVILLLSACGPTGSGSGNSGGNSGGAGGGSGGSAGNGTGGSGGHVSCPQASACPGGATVTGKVFAPNGTDPI